MPTLLMMAAMTPSTLVQVSVSDCLPQVIRLVALLVRFTNDEKSTTRELAPSFSVTDNITVTFIFGIDEGGETDDIGIVKTTFTLILQGISRGS